MRHRHRGETLNSSTPSEKKLAPLDNQSTYQNDKNINQSNTSRSLEFIPINMDIDEIDGDVT